MVDFVKLKKNLVFWLWIMRGSLYENIPKKDIAYFHWYQHSERDLRRLTDVYKVCWFYPRLLVHLQPWVRQRLGPSEGSEIVGQRERERERGWWWEWEDTRLAHTQHVLWWSEEWGCYGSSRVSPTTETTPHHTPHTTHHTTVTTKRLTTCLVVLVILVI